MPAARFNQEYIGRLSQHEEGILSRNVDPESTLHQEQSLIKSLEILPLKSVVVSTQFSRACRPKDGFIVGQLKRRLEELGPRRPSSFW